MSYSKQFENLEKIILSQYEILNNKVNEIEKNIREEIGKINDIFTKMQVNQTNNEKDIIRIQTQLAQFDKNYSEYKDQERQYGKDNFDRISKIEFQVDKNKLSLWKLTGIASGIGVVIGIVISVLQLVFGR